MCDIVHALMVEKVEADARMGYDGSEESAPDAARDRLEEWLASTPEDRRAGVSDDEWELRVGLGVGLGQRKAG